MESKKKIVQCKCGGDMNYVRLPYCDIYGWKCHDCGRVWMEVE